MIRVGAAAVVSAAVGAAGAAGAATNSIDATSASTLARLVLIATKPPSVPELTTLSMRHRSRIRERTQEQCGDKFRWNSTSMIESRHDAVSTGNVHANHAISS